MNVPDGGTPAETTLMCECSHHWYVHAESGQTAPDRPCWGYTGSMTPGPLRELCLCAGFRQWTGPRDSRTGEPVKPLMLTTAPSLPDPTPAEAIVCTCGCGEAPDDTCDCDIYPCLCYEAGAARAAAAQRERLLAAAPDTTTTGKETR